MAKSKNRRFLSLLYLLTCFALLCCIFACGSGGGGRGGDDDEATTNNSKLTLEITSNTVTFGTPVTITATLTNAAGNPASNTVVTFTAASAIVTFTPAEATALTNADGIATIILNAASIDSQGATSITASAPITFQGSTVTTTSKPLGITVGGITVTLGTITIGTSPISAYGTSSVSVPVLVNGAAATVPISVTFTSPCVASGKATLSSPVTSSAGVANSTYKDNGCASGTAAIVDTITAAAGDDTATATITVNPTAVNNISFISATPETIGTSTASSPLLSKSSVVKFQVVDNNNKGKSGVGVTFSMLPTNYSSLGITFNPATATSDADGYVTTSVTSGTVPTPVWVVATVTGSSPVIKSQSNTLTITTGLPTQDFFSLSVQSHNPECWTYDGVENPLTIIASDRLGNPVPDGTALNFITEGSQIDPASCTTTSGTCTVNFICSEYRPPDGRVTILAYAVGEKSFADSNGNNSYDSGETFYDLGDIYLDTNENGVWDTSEQYISYASGTDACLTRPSAAALPYGWDVSSKENTCDIIWGINYVRRSAVIALSGSWAFLDDYSPIDMGSSCTTSVSRWLIDVNNNPMPVGTTISTANNNVYYTTADYQYGNATVSIGGSPVLNTNNYGGTPITITVSGGQNCSTKPILQYPQGSVDIIVTTPKANTTTIPFAVTGDTVTVIPTLILTAGSSSVKTGTGTTLTATVTNQFGYGIAGINVNFTISTNNSGASLSNTSLVTNASGQAVVNYTAGITSGVADTISASMAGDSDTVVISVTP
ncbi:MAG: hypothetical protein JW976_11110 [Syntrophaceae bacterium]|nr:hypothetical protein [Syntrophaceae bacterium]